MKTKFYLLAFSLLIVQYSICQDFTQTIRGQVIDKQNLIPLPGANVLILNGESTKGTITNEQGYYVLEKVPTGRTSLQITFIGYHPVVLSNINITTGKEVVINVELEEKVIKGEEVVIKASKNKSTTVNQMATISARTFSIEESQRYAGALNDVSRMASNYAGVNTSNDKENGIVIRGNSPNGLLWRLEGIDIPNPNHFGFMGATSGPVSMLNNNVLTNSDFITAAFPSEYGNALSGVFDLHMRNGNYDKHEFLGQVGFNGFELGAEGPLYITDHSSYLINYRYSTLAIFHYLGIEFGTGDAVPFYQDLTFKANIPTNKAGKFSVFGLGGENNIHLDASIKDTNSTSTNFYDYEFLDIDNRNMTGVLGLNHVYPFNERTYIKTGIAMTGLQNKSEVDSVSPETLSPMTFADQTMNETKFVASVMLNNKFGPRLNTRVGGIYKHINYQFETEAYLSDYQRIINFPDESGSTDLIQAFLQAQYKFTDDLSLNSGLHYMHLQISNSNSLEPRIGITYRIKPAHAINVGYGLHSKMQIPLLYFGQVDLSETEFITPNKDLDLTKSHHFVVGYDWNITSTLRFKIETYYQYIFNAVVEESTSTFSILNASWDLNNIPDSLNNDGTATNMGVDITFEKFLDRGLYYLVTASFFDSKYIASDGNEYSTAFNGNYVINILGGKEFEISRKNTKNKKFLTIDGKIAAAGGRPYTPLDLEASIASGSTKYDDTRPYSERFDNYFRADLRVSIRIDSKRVSQEWALDIQNLTNHENPLYMYFDLDTGDPKPENQTGFYPMMLYRILF